MRGIILALLFSSCSTPDPVSTALKLGEVIITMRHVDDTYEEKIAHLDRRLGRLNKWCRQGETDACARARVLEGEKAQLIESNNSH